VRNPFNAGTAVVHDLALETEAERMGRQVTMARAPIQRAVAPPRGPARSAAPRGRAAVVQRYVYPFRLTTNNPQAAVVGYLDTHALEYTTTMEIDETVGTPLSAILARTTFGNDVRNCNRQPGRQYEYVLVYGEHTIQIAGPGNKSWNVKLTVVEPVYDQAADMSDIDTYVTLKAGVDYPDDKWKALAYNWGKSGPDGSNQNAAVNVNGQQLMHRTQKAGNRSLWYKWSGQKMELWALAEHANNNSRYIRVSATGGIPGAWNI